MAAIKGDKTTAELSSAYGVHATQINNWKKAVVDTIPEAFSSKRRRVEDEKQSLVDELYKQIGQLKVENDYLKKL